MSSERITTMRKAAALCGVMVVAAAAVSFAQAGRPPAPAPRQDAKAVAPAVPGSGQPAAVGRGLGLSADQREKVRALRETQRTEMRTARDRLIDARRALRDLRGTGTFDEAAFRAAANALAAAQVEVMVLRARHRAQFLELLTPEQRERARQLGASMPPPGRQGWLGPAGRGRMPADRRLLRGWGARAPWWDPDALEPFEPFELPSRSDWIR